MGRFGYRKDKLNELLNLHNKVEACRGKSETKGDEGSRNKAKLAGTEEIFFCGGGGKVEA